MGSARAHKKEAYHHGDLRAALVAATRALIEKKGPEGFSVAEAARAAGVSTAAPYRHFKDRTALMAAVSLDGKERLAEAFARAAAPHPPGSLAAIAAMGQAYVAFAVAQPGLFRLMFAAHDGEDEALQAAGERCFGQLLHHLALRMDSTPDDPAVQRAGLPLWTFVHGASFLTLEGKLAKVCGQADVDAMIAGVTARLLGPSPRDV